MQEHRQQLIQLRSLADADVAALMSIVAGSSVADVRNALIEVLPDLVAPYLTASGELAAVMFEDLRVEAGVRGTFYAESATPALAPARAEATVRWAVSPLADESLKSSVESRLRGSMARMIMDASRDTMQANGAREKLRFQRVPRGAADTCDFCVMLASRPSWVAYTSNAAAQAGSHDNCHCVVAPLYPGSEMASMAADVRRKYMRVYTGEESLDGS